MFAEATAHTLVPQRVLYIYLHICVLFSSQKLAARTMLQMFVFCCYVVRSHGTQAGSTENATDVCVLFSVVRSHIQAGTTGNAIDICGKKPYWE